MRPIDADEVIKPSTIYTMRKKDLVEAIKNAPTLDVVPVVHAHWIPIHNQRCVNGHIVFGDSFECSNCGQGNSGGRFCEECGSEMDEEAGADGNQPTDA